MTQNHTSGSAKKPERPIIDARGLNCPLPVLKLRKHLLATPATAQVELLATDRAALRDIPAFCQAHGYAVEASENGPELRFVVTRGGTEKYKA